MAHLRLLAAGAVAFVTGAVIPATTSAHPVFAPFDDTQFAPILRFGPLISLDTVVTGLTAPNKGVTAPGDSGHLYVVDQVGIAWKVDLTAGTKTTFLDVSSRLVPLGAFGPNSFDERGFLGLAFHPEFRQNGLFYTYTSEPSDGTPTFPSTLPPGIPADHQNVVAEWQITPGAAPIRRELLRVDWPQFNHNGGDLAFGPDRKLYISMGDGGNADDQGDGHLPTTGNAQSLSNPLGKILRIDVNGRNSANGQYGIPADNPFVARANVVKEILAFGFRNPFRISFDRKKGDLYVSDAGQNDIEEVSRVVAGGNHGWNIKEGTLFFNPNGDADGFATPDPVPGRAVPAGLIDPIAQYDTHWEGHAVIAGFVYRGARLSGLNGRLIFGDFSRMLNFPSGPHDYGRLFHINAESGGRGLRAISEFHITPSNAPNIAVLGFGEDAQGEVYVLGNSSGVPFGTGGVVLQLVPADKPPQSENQADD